MKCPIKPGYLVQWAKQEWWIVKETKKDGSLTLLFKPRGQAMYWSEAVAHVWKYAPANSLGRKLYDI